MAEDADTSEAEKLDKLHFEVVPFSLGIGRNQTSHRMEEASGWLSGERNGDKAVIVIYSREKKELWSPETEDL